MPVVPSQAKVFLVSECLAAQFVGWPEAPVTWLLYGAVLGLVHEWICWACQHEGCMRYQDAVVPLCLITSVYLGGIHEPLVLARDQQHGSAACCGCGSLDFRASLEQGKISLIAKKNRVFSLR